MDTAVVPATGVVNDGTLLVWASNVGLGRKVEQLIAARRDLSSVLAEAQGKEIQNQALLLHLREAWSRACSAKDLLCELDYYRIHGEMEQPDDKLLHDIVDQNFLLSAPGSDIKFSNNDIAETAEDASTEKVPVRNEGSATPTAEIIPYITNTMVVANTGPVSHYEILGKDISWEISEQIEECCRITGHVRKAVELENLDYRIMQIHNSTKSDYRESSPYHTEPKVHGRDQERDFIISKLTNEESTTKKFSVIAITGHGGVGKTTLARLVCNNSIVSKHFDILLWVYVSVHFDQVKIMRELLDTLCGDSHENNTKSDELQEKLEYMLKLKRVLLVMDDMWEDSKKETWDGLINALLTNDVYGNKVLVTTRKPSVATMIGASDRINLDGLNKGDFWHLFKECAFGDENYKGEKKQEKIGQRIVERLKGNPLAAKTLGKVLRRKFDVDYWRRILDTSEWKYRSDEDDIMPALMISYKYLPHHLQRCFSYCAVFPKYHRYDQESLVHMWIAQDFVYSLDVRRRPEDIGIEYLNGLVDGGFLEKQSELSSLLIMHDLIHDLAQKVSLDESFTIENSDPRDIPLLVQHVSVITEREYKTETDGLVHPNEQFLEEFSNSVIKLRRRSLST